MDEMIKTWTLRFSAEENPNVEKVPGGGGYSGEFWIGVCHEGSWTLTLFKN